MSKFLGKSASLALFADGTNAVVIDVDFGTVTEFGDSATLAKSRRWSKTDAPEESLFSLADVVLGQKQDEPLLASARLYTIPAGVQAEAKKALEWRKEEKRGGTPVGLNTARTLAKGGQIGIEKIRHIAKYFPRHAVDKKGKGWVPGEDNFPSNGRIAWALWGGEPAKRWASAIVERENKKALKADGYQNYELADLESFKSAMMFDETASPEFLARVRLDGSGIDRIYKINIDGNVYVWDDGTWDNLGHIEGDIWTYDRALDDPYDLVEKSHVEIDPESAIHICGRMQSDPTAKVSIFELDSYEAQLASDAIGSEDWVLVDRVVTAAGEAPTSLDSTVARDGYTPEERAQNAKKQVRDGGGRFAKQGGRVRTAGNRQGTITGVNAGTQTVTIAYDDGETATVSASDTRMISDTPVAKAVASPTNTPDVTPLDVSGILGQPRTPIDRPSAQIPGTLPAMSSQDLSDVINNWDSWVANQRASFIPQVSQGTTTNNPSTVKSGSSVNPKTSFDKADSKYATTGEAGKILERLTGYKQTMDAYDHPLLKNWLNQKDSKGKNPNAIWYQPVTSSAGLKKEEHELTPVSTDVPPLYFAIVAPEDPRAVTHLVCLVPVATNSNAPQAFERIDAKWVKAPQILADLKSATPPPVVPLDTETLNDVLIQVDGIQASAYKEEQMLMVLWGPDASLIASKKQELEALFAAGGFDRNRGNAEALREYWTRGKGAAKIRWGTKGDWTRCVRQLGKYLGPRAKGYCALRHKEVTGLWTGDKKHRQMYGRTASGATVFSNQVVSSSYEVIAESLDTAILQNLRDRVHGGITASAGEGLGPKFRIPLVIPEQLESGDGRKFKKGAIEIRELPLPLMWQIKTGDGHSGSVVVGRIDFMERTEDGIGNCYGYLDTGAHAKEVARLIKYGFIKGISADMDRFEATQEKEEASEGDSSEISKDKIIINKARVMGITIVPKPAFQECKIYLEEDANTSTQEEPVISDGIYADDADPNDAESLVACGFVAGQIPLQPPTEWFENPSLDKPTPLTIDETGRVYGHIAAWHVDHIGLAFGTKPPRSRSNYAYFHTGVVRTEEGTDVPVGQLTLAGGHAPLHASASEAVRHYDDTASAFADVHAGEDKFGIWVAGALRPGITPEQIRSARATAPSGDWRPIRNSLELVAVCQVNVPGFPIARARVASGAVMALVAAGASTLAKMKSDPMTELADRVNKLEAMTIASERSAELEAIKAKFAEAKADIEEYGDFAFISRQTRERLAKKGQAMADGSFPVRNVADLKNAIKAYGRASDSKKASVKEFIKKRARALKKEDLIPEEWTKNTEASVVASAEDLRARVASAQERLGKAFAVEPEVLLDENGKEIPAEDVVIEVDEDGNPVESGSNAKGTYTPQTQPRDEHGKFRKILARLAQDLGTAGLQKIAEEARTVEGLHEIGDYAESAKAAGKLIDIVDRLDAGALNKISLENVRSSAAELGKVISNLPLGFNNQADKLRYTDLPPALRDLMDDMITRVEDKIGKKDADIATEALRGFKSGSDVYSQAEISSQMSKLLRLLT